VALQVVSMEELKLGVLLEPERTGETVAEVCERHGISRASFYRYRRRYLEEGVAGLTPRSRRPRSSPAQIEPTLEARIVELRRRHQRWGARRIYAELGRAGIEPPAVATIHRALRRNHLVAPQPPRRPKATKRFEREVANDLWQIDGTQVRLAGGEAAWVVDCLDDHARYLLSAIACASPSGAGGLGLLPLRQLLLRAAASAPLRQPLQLHRPPARDHGRVRAQARQGRGRADQRRARPPADAGQARALPPHAQGVARRRGTSGRPRAPAAPARPLPKPLQRGAAAPRDPQPDPRGALPARTGVRRASAPRRARARRARDDPALPRPTPSPARSGTTESSATSDSPSTSAAATAAPPFASSKSASSCTCTSATS
jgi:transposase